MGSQLIISYKSIYKLHDDVNHTTFIHLPFDNVTKNSVNTFSKKEKQTMSKTVKHKAIKRIS